MNRWFFHWHRGWVIPPLQSTPPRLVLRVGHRLVKFPNVSWVEGGVTNLQAPLGRSVKKKVHTKRGKDIIWWTWRIGSSFCWISIGFVLLVIFFLGEVVGPGTGPCSMSLCGLKKKRFGRRISMPTFKTYIPQLFSSHFHLCPAPHPPAP